MINQLTLEHSFEHKVKNFFVSVASVCCFFKAGKYKEYHRFQISFLSISIFPFFLL